MTDTTLAKALDRFHKLVGNHRLLGTEAALLVVAASIEDAVIVSNGNDFTPHNTPVTSTTPISEPVADATEIIQNLPPLPEINVTIPVHDQAVRSIRERYLQD